ncbi:HD domain-containing protein [Halobacteroides halobius DSM 5150]|uniref:HD domain-containing protein n=1 Tax=Halobacteroides halobius (strain ATCC 35273 / DSM 5150 / MD-1) TaxID=748449 RepID=L0K903_HALHC|nr:HD domain-containing protein [Halobacteroides halobius]AGB41767.1 HD domain-containing protein [Halobacteroides halobius DSM 5150]
MSKITLQEIKDNERIKSYIKNANQQLDKLGYTEHGFRHAGLVSEVAGRILEKLNYPQRKIELAQIAGYLHDIGNLINRENHGHYSALLVERILNQKDVCYDEIATIMGAVGNHDHKDGAPVNAITAALIIADKSDVHHTRVRNKDFATFDIHDRVNYAAKGSDLIVNKKEETITLNVEIDTEISLVMEYFEIFLDRMMLCRKAAEVLDCKFHLIINGAQIL